MTTLRDGTVIPSYLGASSSYSRKPNSQLTDNSLRLGEVRGIVYPNDPGSYSKRVVEYDIDVQYRDGEGVSSTSKFRGVAANNIFGGIADQFHATYRAEPNPKEYSSNGFGVGSKVLVACVGGSQQFGIILGGIKDPDDEAESKADGHNLFFEFNGVRVQIKDDGELELTFRGKTKVDGELDNSAVPEAEGTRLQINKEGNFLIATPDDAQYVKFNHQDHKLEVLADTEWNVQVNGQTVITSQGSIEVTTNAEATHNASGNIFMRSAGVHVGGATDQWVKGTTYRNAESSMNNQLLSVMQSVSQQLTDAATSLQTAAIANAISGSTAAPDFSKAAVALAQMGALFVQMAGVIQVFEAASGTYLSNKNLTD